MGLRLLLISPSLRTLATIRPERSVLAKGIGASRATLQDFTDVPPEAKPEVEDEQQDAKKQA